MNKHIIFKILPFNWIWKKLDAFLHFGWKVSHQRKLYLRKQEEEEQQNTLKELFPEPIVLNGIFKGMRYPKFRSRNSSLYSKLVGSYEKELEQTFIDTFNIDYKEILDIGCAEGYFAVGLAMKFKGINVKAYDIETEARELTKQMAELNGVGERVIVDKSMSAKDLKDYSFKGRTLIICDTEGYEKQLFTQESIGNLSDCDLIIETHDWVDINISTDLETLFSSTHHIEVIQSLGDNIKAKNYHFPQTEGLDLLTKFRIFEEGRRYTDEWLILKSKKFD